MSLFQSLSEKVKDLASESVDSIANTTKDVSDKVNLMVEEYNTQVEKAKAEKLELQRLAEEELTGYYFRDGKLIVSSVEGMNTWLNNVSQNATPALVQTLQMQLEVLQYVQTPSLIGMALDNMIVRLDKALKLTNNEEEIANIREAFAYMIQNYFFMHEVNFICAQKKNKQETISLLKQSGEMLSKSIARTAQILSFNTIDISRVEVRNIFEANEIQKFYINSLFAWINKKQLEEEREKFYKTIDSIFYTLDLHANLLGPSLIIHGMLQRYRTQLIDYRKMKRMQIYADRGYSIDPQKLSVLSDGISNIIAGFVKPNKLGAMSGVANMAFALGGLLTDYVNKDKTILDIDAFCAFQNALELEAKEKEQELNNLNSDIEKLNQQLKSLSIFQISQKKELQAKIDLIEDAKTRVSSELNAIKEELSKMKHVAPDAYAFKSEIENYDKKLLEIENKYLV